MAVYCMADIHGMQDAFHNMLEKIHFSPQDHLYILGDVIDRGPHGISLLQEIRQAANITMLLGNHEYMMLDYYKHDVSQQEIRRWNKNGNEPTRREFLQLSQEEQQELLEFLRSLPVSLEITVGGQDFYLVHGFPGNTVHDMVWHRPAGPDIPAPIPGKQLIIGHTPVQSLVCTTDLSELLYVERLRWEKKLQPILHTEGYIDIDCCCGHAVYGSALACLRLDDMQEFYVPAPFLC